ncbi:hypothetical protein AMTRI_Chr05g64860 [Amborella trichopoda]
MDFSTVLQMQESCSCVNTQNFMSIDPKVIGKDDGDWSEKMVFGVSSSSWRSMWRKLKRGKRKICRPTLRSAMNFDHGVASFEPDNQSRSFSTRFADPSRISRSVGW